MPFAHQTLLGVHHVQESGTLYTGMTNSLDRRVLRALKITLIRGFTAKYDCRPPYWFKNRIRGYAAK